MILRTGGGSRDDPGLGLYAIRGHAEHCEWSYVRRCHGAGGGYYNLDTMIEQN